MFEINYKNLVNLIEPSNKYIVKIIIVYCEVNIVTYKCGEAAAASLGVLPRLPKFLILYPRLK